MGEYKVGQLVELNDGRKGRIRYVGDFHVKAGTWIGIELEDTSGKNDGEVQGQRYFQCAPNRGMFVQPQGIGTILQQPAAASSAVTANKRASIIGNGTAKPVARASALGRSTASTTATTTLAAKRQSISDPTKARQTLNQASPTPTARPGAVRSTASPSKPAPRTATVSTSSRPGAGATASTATSLAAKRTSLAGRPSIGASSGTAATRTTRTSTVGAAAVPSRSTASTTTAARRPAATTRAPALQSSRTAVPGTRTEGLRRLSVGQAAEGQDASEQQQEQDDQDDGAENGSPAVATRDRSGSLVKDATTTGSSRQAPGSATLSRPTTQQLSAQNRKIEDLETKLRVMEKQQLESRDRLKEMERIQSDRDRFEVIIQKLQAKIQPQVEEIHSLKKELRDTNAKLEEADQNQMDVDDAVELATVDREMAEELAEGYKAELDALRIKHDELVLEVDILRAENEDLGREMSPEERNSMGFAQLERSNERLRDALIRLRDMTQDTEAEFKSKIKDLEDDLEEFATLKPKYEETQEQLGQVESLVEELKQQLETAQGSEEMIEELTEKNMSLTEQIEELKMAIQDLEDLREINDELELNHIEHEKAMQDDIDYRDGLLIDQARKSVEQDAAVEELEYTVSRFRELVSNLNADLEEMKASQQISETEANELSSRTKAMMDMNMRLQQSAAKTQVKIIDTELSRLGAQESLDQLTIIQRFLPDSYLQHKDSTAAFLRFKRVSFKSSLMYTIMKERVAGKAVSGREDDIFAACDLLDKLTWVSATCQRFVKYVVSCPLETWEKMGSITYDLEPVERAFNGWIDAIKRDDFKDGSVVTELHRTMSVLEHLGERYFGEGLADYSEQVYIHATMIQGQLDSAAAAISQIKEIAKSRVVIPSDADEGDEQEIEAFNSRADTLIAQVRSISVVAAKSLQQLDELTARGMTLEPSTQGTVENTQSIVEAFASACRTAGGKISALINDDSRTDSISYEHLVTAISADDAAPFSSLASQANSVSNAVQAFSNLTITLSATVEFDVPPSADDLAAQTTPWSQLSARIQAEMSATADLDSEIARLNDTISERSTALAMKDKTISELGVTIEVLQKRADDGAKATSRARDLEIELESILKKRDALEAQIEKKEDEIRHLKSERETWVAAGAAAGADGSNGPLDEARMARAMEDMAEGGYIPAKAAQELGILRAELEATRSVVRQLRQASTEASFQAAYSDGILGPLNAEEPTDIRKQQVLVDEKDAMDALKALRQIVNRSADNANLTTMKNVDKGNRLKWRPADERLGWQVGVKREEWESWNDWVKDIAKQADRRSERSATLRQKASSTEGKVQPRTLARLTLRSPLAALNGSKPPLGSEIKIVDPNEWDGLNARLSIGL